MNSFWTIRNLWDTPVGLVRFSVNLINFLHCWPSTTRRSGPSTRHTTFWHTSTTTCSLVDLHHDRVHNSFKFLLLCFKFVLFGKLVLIQPIQGLLDSAFYLLLVSRLKLVFEFFFIQCVAHREAIILQTVFRFDLRFVRFVLGTVLFCFLHHAVNLSLGQSTFFISDGDLVGFPRGLVLG